MGLWGISVVFWAHWAGRLPVLIFKPYPQDIFITAPCGQIQEPCTAWVVYWDWLFFLSFSRTFQPSSDIWLRVEKWTHEWILRLSSILSEMFTSWWYRSVTLDIQKSPSLHNIWAPGDHQFTRNALLWLWPVSTGYEWNRWADHLCIMNRIRGPKDTHTHTHTLIW